MKDLQLKDERVFEAIGMEGDRQVEKWGIQDRHPFEWLAYTTEELGSLSKAISEFIYRDGMRSNVVKEACHVATLSAKILEMFLNMNDDEIFQLKNHPLILR